MSEVLDTLAEDRPIKASNSLLDGLRQKRLETLDETTKKFPIPGYDDQLWAEYRGLEPKELEKLAKRVTREFKKSRSDIVLYGAMDSLLESCVAIHVRNDAGDLVPLHEVRGDDTPIVFDVRLAETLGFEPGPTGRTIIYDTFCQRDMAIIRQNIDLSNWMAGISDPLRDDDLGEA